MMSLFYFNEGRDLLRGFKHYSKGNVNRKVLFFQHGYFSANCSGPNRLFFEIAEIGLLHGFDSLRIDMIGTGISDGAFESSNYEDNLRVYRRLISHLETNYDEIILIGHSMGTSYSLLLSLEAFVSSAVFISPSFGKIDKISALLNRRQLKDLDTIGITERKGLIISKQFLDRSQTVNIEYYKSRLTIPILFIYASNDEIYSNESLRSFVNGWINSKEFEILGADHNFIDRNPRKQLLKVISDFLK